MLKSDNGHFNPSYVKVFVCFKMIHNRPEILKEEIRHLLVGFVI